MSSVIKDSNGFEHLAKTYFPNTGDTTLDLFGTLSAATPFYAIVLKPTSASFETGGQQSMVGWMSTDQKRFIAVLFTNSSLENSQIGIMLKFLGREIPEESQGMWVISIPFEEDLSSIESNGIQLFQITDGTNILIPEVNLAELTGVEAVDSPLTVEDASGLFQGSFEEDNVTITSIAGCEICFRLTQAQALQYLLDQITKRIRSNK